MELNDFGKSYPLPDGKARILHTGTTFGSVHPSHPDFSDRFDQLLIITQQPRILAQKLGFNTKVTPVSDLSELVPGTGMKSGEMINVPGFYRTPEASDGVVVSLNGDTRLKIAVAIMNADCGVIKILAPNGEIAVLHGGFDNVDNKDGSSIVSNAIEYFVSQGFTPSELSFSVGEAAGPCCYGFKTENPQWKAKNEERANRLRASFGNDVIRIIENPPRKSGLGFDVSLIAARQADKAGIQDIEVETLCTSCHGLSPDKMTTLDTYGNWYSNLRENPATTKQAGFGSRNAAVVYCT